MEQLKPLCLFHLSLLNQDAYTIAYAVSQEKYPKLYGEV